MNMTTMKFLALLCAIFTISFITLSHTAYASENGSGYQSTVNDKIQHWIDTREGKKTVKPYHRAVHQNGETNCALCHGNNNPVQAPEDKNCEACHGSAEQVAELTKRNEDEASGYVEPNPHNSVHYGTDLSCTACHKEHQKSEIYCNSCHLFKYPDMKE